MNNEVIDPRECVDWGDYEYGCTAEICVGACGFKQEDGDWDDNIQEEEE